MENSTLATMTLCDDQGEVGSLCLVLVWHREALDFLGAVAILPPVGAVSVGRGEGSDLQWILHHPEGRPSPVIQPLASPRVSRQQFDLVVEAEQLHVTNMGRCKMRLDGKPCAEGRVEVGQMIELEREAIFLLCRRPRSLPFVPGFEQAFGEQDSFGTVGEGPASWALRAQLHVALQDSGHVLVRGDDGTEVRRVMKGLNAAAFDWQTEASPAASGAVWIQDAGRWCAERPGEAIALAESMGLAGRRLVLSGSTTEELPFALAAQFPLRVTLPSCNERLEDLPLLAVQFYRTWRQDASHAGALLVSEQPQFRPEWVRFLMTRTWTEGEAELLALLIDAIHRSKDGWIYPPDRADSIPPETSKNTLNCLVLPHGQVNFDRREIRRNGEVERLTPMEVRLLRYLTSRIGEVVTRADLLTDVWNYKANIETQAVENTIHRLRKKLEPDPKNPTHIQSIWGVGYRFENEA